MFLLVLFSCLLAQAQSPNSIQGVVLERGTLKPLSGVNVYLLPSGQKALSEENGSFLFSELPQGLCEVIVNVTGYKKYSQKVDCQNLSGKKIYLERVTYNSFETTVTSKVEKRDDQAQVLSQEEFMKAPGSFGGDPIRATQNLPGVAANAGSAQIIVQGAGQDDTGYVINGHRVPIIFHFAGLSSVVMPEAVEKVELLPAGYGPEYSRAIGGIVGLTTKSPKSDRIHGMAYVDFLNAGGAIEGPINQKSSFFVGTRYSYIGQVLKAVAKNNENLSFTSAPTYYDLTGIYRNQINDKNIFKTTFVFSKDQLELALNRPANNDPKLRGSFFNSTEFFRVIPSLSTRLSESLTMENSLGIGQDKILVDIAGRYLDVKANVISQRFELQKVWSKTYKNFWGLDNQWTSSDVGVNLPSRYDVGGVQTPFSVGQNKKFRAQSSSAQLGAYIRNEYKTSEDSLWTFLPNLRLDYFSLTKETSLQPRLQARYQQNPQLQYRASWGVYSQQPLPQETSKNYGNKAIKNPYALHSMVGLKYEIENISQGRLEILNNYFYKDLKNLVIPDVVKNYNNSGKGQIIGTEIQAKYRKDLWSTQVVYTLLKSERRIPGLGTTPSEFDQTHNLNIIGSYNSPKWTYSARLRLVTGLPFTPITGASFDSDNDVFLPQAGQIYSQRFSGFNQLDVRIDRKIIYDEWILSAYLDIQNLMNAQNPQGFQYAYDYSSRQTVRGLPILPTIGLKGEF